MNFLWNPAEKRLRLPFRLFLGGLVIGGFLLFVSLLVSFLATLAFAAFGNLPLAESISRWQELLAGQSLAVLAFSSAATLFATLAAMRFVGRRIDRRTAADYGLALTRLWGQDFAFGLALGAGLVTLIFLVEWAAGWVTPVGFLVSQTPGQPFLQALIAPVVLFISVGIYEEILTRGWLYRNLLDGAGFLGPRGAKIVAVLLTSAIFGFLHGTNPNSTWITSLNLVLMGGFLALGVVLTGRLGISIGLHITWNFFMGNVFGFPVSGTGASATTFIQVTQSGPDWLTGGAFGPEGGVLGLATALLGSGLVMLWVCWRQSRTRVPAQD